MRKKSKLLPTCPRCGSANTAPISPVSSVWNCLDDTGSCPGYAFVLTEVTKWVPREAAHKIVPRPRLSGLAMWKCLLSGNVSEVPNLRSAVDSIDEA